MVMHGKKDDLDVVGKLGLGQDVGEESLCIRLANLALGGGVVKRHETCAWWSV